MSAERFAGRLKELREQKGWTQKQLADMVSMNQYSIAQFEQGRNKPSWETVAALADALGVSCESFRQEPATAPDKRGPGRPSKHQEPEGKGTEEMKAEAPRRKRGRPRKAEGA